MPHDLTHRRLTATPPATRDADGRPRFVVLHRRGPTRQRRGIVLIFVVVLLTLLAIMGTAYLATSRIDRQAIAGRGALPGATTPLLTDQSTIRRVADAAETRVKQAIIQDLFAVRDREGTGGPFAADYLKANPGVAFAYFRARTSSATANLYENYDAPGRADGWLSGLLPRRVPGIPSGSQQYYAWNWIGRPVAGSVGSGIYFDRFFSDPRYLQTNGYPGVRRFGEYDPTLATGIEPDNILFQRRAPVISSVALTRSGSTDVDRFPTRVYPGLTPSNPTNGNPVAPSLTNTFIAGDADGDGIADSGLIPIQINPAASPNDGTSIDQYLDRANGVVYFMSYRVVDNSAKLNIQTALTNYGDVVNTNISGTGEAVDANNELRHFLASDPAAITGSDIFAPNYGFFRSNVGLFGLLRTFISPINPAAEAGTGYLPADAELRRLIDARFPQLRQPPGTNYDNNVGGTGIDAGRDIDKLAMQFAAPTVSLMYLGTPAAIGAQPAGFPLSYQYRSFGDLIEQQVARRIATPGGYLWTASTAATVYPSVASNPPLGLSDALSFGAKGGALVNPLITAGTGETALLFTARMSTPNVNNNGSTPWGWFPPGAVDLWFNWTQDFEATNADGATSPITIPVLDANTPEDRAFQYLTSSFVPEASVVAPNQPAKPAGLADVYLPRSPRALLTTYNGVTTQVPQRTDFGGEQPGLPMGMPAYSVGMIRTGPPYNEPAGSNYPPTKVSAASGSKEQLWRAFWSAMTQQDPINGKWIPSPRILPSSAYAAPDPRLEYDAFRSCDRYPSAEGVSGVVNGFPQLTSVMTPRQMTLIRSAVAACNTVDLRDNDNDITAMTIDVTDNAAATTRFKARVYGTEKQLVISSVYMENTPTGGDYVAVEIYNPTDIPIQLSAYRLSVMTRNAPVAPVKTTGVISNAPATVPNSIPLSAATTDFLPPGGYMFISDRQPPDTTTMNVWPLENKAGTSSTPAYWHNVTPAAAALLNPLMAANTGTQELVLTRTRRADGVAFVDGTATAANSRLEVENEDVDDPRTLVPVDAVDCRLSTASPVPPGTPIRYIYQRMTPAPIDNSSVGTNSDPLSGANAAAPRDKAWRCFYAGKFYNLRTDPTVTRGVATGNAELMADASFAWRDLSSATALEPAVAFGESPARRVVNMAASPAYGPVMAPPIMIQNAMPYDPFTVTNKRGTGAATPPGTLTEIPGGAVPGGLTGVYHLINKFPYGSPFARDADLLSIPYIGTYKIYRVPPAAPPVLYEFVPLTMDAVNVAPDPMTVAQPGLETKTVGLFDPRYNPATTYAPLTDGQQNEWAASLTDFVSARTSPYRPAFPDVPDSSADTAGWTTVGGAGAADDHTRAQDGPVSGTGGVSGFNDVTFTRFTPREPAVNEATANSPRDPNGLRVGDGYSRRRGEPTNSSSDFISLTQGVVNVNTAPSVVLRQLPWIVNPDTGLVDFAVDSASERDIRAIANSFIFDREKMNTDAWTTAEPGKPFGFGSLAQINTDKVKRISATSAPNATATMVTGYTADQLLRSGVLNPLHRPEAAVDYRIDNLNLARVSNLTSTRSDVFTVYVTVQAWTWSGSDANQPRDTRLVGERRSSFIVDRSRISQSNFAVSDLITYPIERE